MDSSKGIELPPPEPPGLIPHVAFCCCVGLEAVKKAKRTYLCGNGGSAANANHIANDLISVGIKAYSLCANVATLTAIANDFAYKHVFSDQIKVLCEQGDLLIALSGSGESPNIIEAIDAARRLNMDTFLVTGSFANGAARDRVHEYVAVGRNMQRAEEYQLQLGHEIMLAIKVGR